MNARFDFVLTMRYLYLRNSEHMISDYKWLKHSSILGTVGNGLSFLVMSRDSMRKLTTCFYLRLLAIFDTGTKHYFFLSYMKPV